MAIKVLSPDKDFVRIPFVKGHGDARAIIWPGMGAKYGSMNYFIMKPGEENVPHAHKDCEDMFYIAQGCGVIIDFDTNIKHPFKKGCFIFVEPGTQHAAVSFGPEDYISVGGPSPIDYEMYKKAGLKW